MITLVASVVLAAYLAWLVRHVRQGTLTQATVLRDPLSLLLVLLAVGVLVFLHVDNSYRAVAQSEQEIREFLREQDRATNPQPYNGQFWQTCDPYDIESLANYGYDFELEHALMNMIDFTEYETGG